VAKRVKKVTGQALDEDEIMSVVKIDLKKLIGMIKSGKIIDSKTICAVLTYAAKNRML
jgi:ADP-ribose pyrophosphatase